MGFLASILGAGAGEAAKGVAEGVSTLAKGLRTAITGIDPDKRAELEQFIEQADALDRQAQSATNKIEAAHKSIFVAGWRPALGWVCAISLGAYFIPQYLLGAVLWVKASWYAQALQPYPVNADGLIQLVLALLGLAGWRTMEKKWNVQDNH